MLEDVNSVYEEMCIEIELCIQQLKNTLSFSEACGMFIEFDCLDKFLKKLSSTDHTY